jgi:putative transposase
MGILIAWTDIARAGHHRDALRLPPDLTDRGWAVTAPLIPPAKRGGRSPPTDMRAVGAAILFNA